MNRTQGITRIEDINQIVQRAKQQRAEYIGSKIQAHALPIAVVAALSLALVQFTAEPVPEQARDGHVVQVAAFSS